MTTLRLVNEGILYINTDPAHHHVAAFFPNIVQLSEEELICVFQRGDGMYAVNSNVALLRSRDGGATWSDEGFLYDKAEDDRSYSYHNTLVSRMRDGTLVASLFRANRSDPAQPFFNESGGLIAIDSVLLISKDKGQSWTDPVLMALPEQMQATSAQSVIELADGRWLATFDLWSTFDDHRPYQPCMVTFSSDDQGRTWTDRVVMADGAADGKGFWHGRPMRLSDDRLFSLLWAADMTEPAKGPINLPIHYTRADAAGREWETPIATDIPGQTHCTTELPDGRLVAIYTRREFDPPGFMVIQSDDGGHTWDLEGQIQVWDATGWTNIGISTLDRYPRSHDTIAFGAPSIFTTLQGDLFASWWCTYASITHLRWARISV